MGITNDEINDLIRSRRSVFPAMYVDKEIPKEVILDILENANWAPTHRMTEPWRFKIIRKNALKRLSEFLGAYYQKHTSPEKFSEKKLEKTLKKPLKCACVIAICMQRDPKESVPEWEEIAAVACAVQNMWLSCVGHGIGAYWSSSKAIEKADLLFDLAEGERCLGFFYMGYYKAQGIESKRKPIEEKLLWLED